MQLLQIVLVLLALLCTARGDVQSAQEDEETGARDPVANTETTAPTLKTLAPTVFLAMLARNTAHTLPYFFSYIDRLDYPKDRIYVWLHTDNNVDNTSLVAAEWAKNVRHLYHGVNFTSLSKPTITDTTAPYEWSDHRYDNVVLLRQEALDTARQMWADYLLFVDCDNYLVESQVLNMLIAENKPIIAPMLTTNREQDYYSNFWCGIDERGYYKRTEDYVPTLRYQRKGCYSVPMVHSTFLVDLRMEASKGLSYWPPLPTYHSDVDDILMFAHSVREAGLEMFILNKEIFGFLPKPTNYETVEDAITAFSSFKIDTLIDFPPVVASEYVTAAVDTTPNGTLGFDHIYMINLERRPDRRNRMVAALKELHLEYEWTKAVDGRELNDSYIEELGITMLPGWKDPWGDRPITKGEIGCFLSHYFIWQKMVEENWQSILIFEDDIKFEPYFRDWMELMLKEIRDNDITWDLVYIGRKRLFFQDESLVEGTETLVRPKYSYWTLSYMLSQSGAAKLLAQLPLQKILPVDEYLPIMFNEHPKEEWSKFFEPKDLEAYSANPLFVYPTYYVGDEYYFSDTEPFHVFKTLNQKQQEELEELKQKNYDDKEEYIGAVHSEL